ncbi:MAG TPA: aminotransferase class III-fold pyridoxal phosphate-dependent enzyme, partial [Actinomycetota bacterium]|nr:aminotransferase class III-fold pyridoxal phosphate-dependent enzyme [Actinomycetota bacterium]
MAAEWTRRDEAVMAPVLSRMTEVVAASAQGSWITDADGTRLLDFTCGIAVCNIGHCHPAVVSAIEKQARTLIHTSVVARSPAPIELAERLCSLTPFVDDPRVFFCNSGAEAVDGALKLARRSTGRPGVIAFRGGFHGRTLAATSLTTAKGRYREGYEPLLPGVYVAPYAEPLRTSAVDALAALDDMLAQVAPPGSIGAMVVEPVLGEGGYVVPPLGWLRGLRERCDEHGILLVFDEVQTGAG